MKSTRDLLCKTMVTLCFLGSSYQNTLLFSTNDFIKEFDLDSGNVTVLASGVDYVFSMDYDYQHGFVYIARYYQKDIQKFNYTLVENITLETVIVTEYYPVGVAIDPVDYHVYWTEMFSSSRRIRRCNFDGTNPVIILDEESPWAISLDLINRWIYFGTVIGTIGRLEMNGTSKQNIIPQGIGYVSDLSIDMNLGYIYWLEYDTGDLKSADINGSNVNFVFDGNSSNSEHGLDVDDKYIYFSSIKQLLRINKFHEKEPYVLLNATETIYSVLMYKTKGNYVKVQPGPYSVQYSKDITLICEIFSNYYQTCSGYWRRDQHDLEYTVCKNASCQLILTISDATFEDSGQYTCHVECWTWSGQSAVVNLTVYGGVPIVDVGDTIYSAEYGEKITLFCNMTSNPPVTKVYWEKVVNDTKNVLNNWTVGIQGASVDAPSLIIVHSTTADIGNYTCVATNGVGTGKSKATTLEVIGELPTVSVISSLTPVKYGERVNIFCFVNAYPIPTNVYWEKISNGITKVISNGTDGTDGITVENPSLILLHATDSDSGHYKCFAVNEFGLGYSSSVKLTVIGGLPEVSVPSLTHLTGTGYTITITCSVKNAFPDVSSVYWQRYLHGSTTIIRSTSIGIKGVTAENPSLIIPSAMESMTSEYTCFAENSVGTGSSLPAKLTGRKINKLEVFQKEFKHIVSTLLFYYTHSTTQCLHKYE
ncbi:HMCN [Mytilus coruscus]|uniref:HMCN n=1 Tax=Mytilus coruscus TaxID=42192 RepID=A0A6J8CCH3_MYTCO|nr:HMCN [Mytilus coruscus]